MWAVAVGSLVALETLKEFTAFIQIAAFPFSWLYGHFGARFVFFGAGLLSAVATTLIPLSGTYIKHNIFKSCSLPRHMALHCNEIATGKFLECFICLSHRVSPTLRTLLLLGF